MCVVYRPTAGTIEIRLMGGEDERQGRVEVKLFGFWAAVCGKDWSASEAKVVCYMLGYT